MGIVAFNRMPAQCAPAIANFVRGYSLAATSLGETDVAELASIAPAGTHVYVNAVATRPLQEIVEGAIRLKAGGFRPVPHVAVRMFASASTLDRFLARLVAEAGVERILVIAGDREAGAFRSSIELIDGGLLQRHGIREIGIAGYPEGHPRIARQDLDRALMHKVAAAEATGIKVHIVTQFCFDPATIVAWISRLRDFGLEQPVRVGLAGPTNLATLLSYARRCGVLASAQGLARQSGLMRQIFAMSTPDALVQSLAQARLGAIKPHFYSFGGLAGTARWASAVTERRITLEGVLGFRVEPAA